MSHLAFCQMEFVSPGWKQHSRTRIFIVRERNLVPFPSMLLTMKILNGYTIEKPEETNGREHFVPLEACLDCLGHLDNRLAKRSKPGFLSSMSKANTLIKLFPGGRDRGLSLVCSLIPIVVTERA